LCADLPAPWCPAGRCAPCFYASSRKRLARLVERALQAGIELGALRADLDAKRLVLSVVNLAACSACCNDE
jgi:hypothetical protein